MSYGNSKKWIAPGVREKQRHEKLNQIRSKICKDSPFWHANFDIDAHKREFNALLQARLHPIDTSPQSPSLIQQLPESSSASTTTTTTTSPSTPSRPAFSGKAIKNPSFTDNLSPVLSLPTIFCPHYKLGNDTLGERTLAPWPSKSEMKYEGDDRIATDKIHGRFLGAPRVEGNETVNWQHRNIIEQYEFEKYHRTPDMAVVLTRSHYVDYHDIEVDVAHVDNMDNWVNCLERCQHLLGMELWDLLDPVDRL